MTLVERERRIMEKAQTMGLDVEAPAPPPGFAGCVGTIVSLAHAILATWLQHPCHVLCARQEPGCLGARGWTERHRSSAGSTATTSACAARGEPCVVLLSEEG